MKQFNKDMYLILPSVLEDLLRQPPINPSIFLDGIKSQSIKGSILLTIEELEKMLYFFFKEGEAHGEESERRDAFAKIQSPDFKKTLSNYLTSKGINITENGK